ncbi:MAG: NUDIX domain-containing protein [Hyphomonadaceae bacterium]
MNQQTIPAPGGPGAVFARPPRPRDAATLALVRRTAGKPEILLGQRARGHVFMPDKWVFPGGRVDPADGAARAASELDGETEALLRLEHGGRRKPRAFALAAVREMFEEAGLVIGRPHAPARGVPPRGWAAYAALGAAPELDKLTFIARAITPPTVRSRRFDARFFMARAEDVLLDDRPIAGDQELLHMRWFDLEEAAHLDLPTITRFVIAEVDRRLAGETLRPAFVRTVRGKRELTARL